MKLEVGMYVRTLNGIVKIDKIKDSVMIDTEGKMHFGDFIKASYNIIDLIEAGDYINGQRVYYDEELDYLYVQCIDGDGNLYYESITKQSFIDNIKSIITKEQFEEMSYKVKESK